MHTTPSPYFAIPWRTGSSSTAYCQDSKDHLRYVFAALGNKSLEMHAQWMPTGSEEEQKVQPRLKASAFLDCIQQGMTHDINTHVHLGELEDIVARLGEDPQDLIAHIKTLMDRCEMINDEHRKHELHVAVSSVHTARRESSLENFWPSHSRHPPMSWLRLLVNHFAIQQAREQVSHSSKPVDAILPGQKVDSPHASHSSHDHTPTAPSKDCPNCTQQHPAGRANCPACDTHCDKCDKMGHWGPKCCMVASHSNQGMHLHLGHSRGSPDAHLGTTTPTKGGSNKTDTIDVR